VAPLSLFPELDGKQLGWWLGMTLVVAPVCGYASHVCIKCEMAGAGGLVDRVAAALGVPAE